MESDPEITLDDLARESGTEARTIRGYVQRGLVPRPSKRGRGATYPPEALDRVLAIKRLMRESGIGLDEIRRLFFRLDEGMIKRIGAGEEPVVAMRVDAMVSEEASGTCESPPDFDCEMTERLATRPLHLRSQPLQPAIGCFRTSPDGGADAFDALLDSLRRLTADRRVHPGSRSEQWIRVRVTPDLELGVRGPLLGARGQAQLEEIADHLRELLAARGGDPEA